MWAEIKAFILGIRTSLLFTPLLFAVGGLVLAFVTVYLDRTGVAEGFVALIPFAAIDEEGARGVLSTIASGMLSVTGIVVSLTFVALTMMSSQLGPRLLLFFMRDRTTKVVLGIFVATIIYSLMSMASVGAEGDATFAPHLSFVVAIVLAVVSLGAMIYFVDHIAHSIQADALVARLARACDEAIEQGLREGSEDTASDDDIARFEQRLSDSDHVWRAPRSGYLAAINYDSLAETARSYDAVIALAFRVNSFVFEDEPVCAFKCSDGDADDLADEIGQAITISERRTPAQQVNFEMSALSEVALRALSPGINDPYTAAACIDYLGSTLSRLTKANPKRRLLQDGDGADRLLRPGDDLPFFLSQCIAPVIEAAKGSPVALDSLIRVLNRLARVAVRDSDLRAIDRQRAALREIVNVGTSHPGERERLAAMLDVERSTALSA